VLLSGLAKTAKFVSGLLPSLNRKLRELAKTAKFVSGLLPSLNRKLRGKDYSSLAHAVETAQIEEWCLGESERCTHGEDQEHHGK